MSDNTASKANNQIEPFRIPLIPNMSAEHNRCLAVLATFENAEQPSWCYDLGYTYLGELQGIEKGAAIRQVKVLREAGYVTVTKRGKVKGSQLSNSIRINWVQVSTQTEPVLAKKREKYKAKSRVASKLPPGGFKATLLPNPLPEEKKVVSIVLATENSVAPSDSKSEPKRIRKPLQRTSRLRGENLKAMVQSWKHDVYKVWADSGGKVQGLDDWIPILEDGTGRTKKDLENFTKAVLSAYEHDLPVYPPDEVMRYALNLKDFWGKPSPLKKSVRLYPESWYMVKTARRFITAMEESGGKYE